MEHWHLIFTKPKKEPLVCSQLEERDLEVFFPYLQFERGYYRGVRTEAFFPNYLFVKVDLTSMTANGLNWLVGLRSIVHFGDTPATIPETVIQALRQRLEPAMRKVLRKDEWLYTPGQSIIVTSGPFRGYNAIFQKGLNGSERVQILLDLVGKWVRTELHVEQIEAQSKRA